MVSSCRFEWWEVRPACSAWASPRTRERSSCAEPRASPGRQQLPQPAKGDAAVADTVLLPRRQLGHRSLLPVGDEDGVVAESARPARLQSEAALADALGRHGPAL